MHKYLIKILLHLYCSMKSHANILLIDSNSLISHYQV